MNLILVVQDKVHAVRYTGDIVEIESRIKKYQTQKLYLPSYIDIKEIELPNSCIALGAEYLDSQHLVLILEGKWELSHYEYYFLEETETCYFDKLSHYSMGQRHF